MPSDDTIGTGGDYTTIAAWEAALPATLSGLHRGRLLNQNFPEKVTISGHTATPTDYIELTADAGASFADDDSLPLRINPSNFARIDLVGPNYQTLIEINTPYTRFNRVQVRQQHPTRLGVSATATGVLCSQIISESGLSALYCYSVENSLIITRGTGSNGVTLVTSGRCEYTTSVHPIGSSSVASGIRMAYGVARLQNSTSFGFSMGINVASTDASSSTNATDENTQETGTDLVNVPYSVVTPFVKSAIDGTEDFKLAAGSPLEGAGNPSANGINIDIYGNPRDASNPSIGCFEPQAVQPVAGPDAIFHSANF